MVEWQMVDTICGVEASNVNATHLPTMLHYTPAGVLFSLFPPHAMRESTLASAVCFIVVGSASCSEGGPLS